MKQLVINTTNIPREVEIIRADGKKDAIHLMGKGRTHLAAGQKVSPNWVARNPKVLRVVEPQTSQMPQVQNNSTFTGE